jgi:arylsulfatase A
MITRRCMPLVITLLLATGLSAAPKPNVVVLFADDLGFKDIGCYDGPVKTPVLDHLAAGGVRFTDFYAGAGVCSPSRAVLLTGRHHVRSGIYSWIHNSTQDAHLLKREVTIAEMLKANGYATAHFGKWHLGMPTHGRKKPTLNDHGFDHWLATVSNAAPSHRNPVNLIRNGKPLGRIEGYACQIIVDEAIGWLEKRDASKPFFLNLWFHEPHAPLAAPDEIVTKYGSTHDRAAIYSGTIDNTDRAIGRLLKKLPKNTIVVYTSDNGSYRPDRVGNLRGIKGANWEGGIRVPGIISWPGQIKPGRVETTPAGVVDLLPTICGLVGIDKPKGVHLDGSDLAPLLRGTAKEFTRHQPLFWMRPASTPTFVLRDGSHSLAAFKDYKLEKNYAKMKMIVKQVEQILRKNGNWESEIRKSTLQKRMFEGFKDKEAEKVRGQYILLNMFQESWIPTIKAGGYGRFELYDLSKDSGQKTDIAEDHPEVVARLKKKLLEINASMMAEAPPCPAKP